MVIYPAVDIYAGKVVRLYQGDYRRMNTYSDRPEEIALAFRNAGAQAIHLVDLEGAKSGVSINLGTIARLIAAFGGFAEVGGGIRSMEAARALLDAGAGRVILGTAAVTDPAFLERALSEMGSRVAVGVDIRDGRIAIRGWTECAALTAPEYLARLQALGVKTVICTDISRDGAMRGVNPALYRELSQCFSGDLIASGGVSSLEDIRALAALGLYGAIIGKAYYTGAIDLRRAIEAAG